MDRDGIRLERLLYPIAASQEAPTVVCVGVFCGTTAPSTPRIVYRAGPASEIEDRLVHDPEADLLEEPLGPGR